MSQTVKVLNIKNRIRAPHRGGYGKSIFERENRNPRRRNAEDCVFRAIAGATLRPWEEVFAGLCQIGLSKHAMPDYPIVFREYIKQIGGEYVYKAPTVNRRIQKDPGMTVNRFAMDHPKGNYVVRVWWHVTCVRNGTIYDTWDCGKEAVMEAWEVKPGARLMEDYQKEVPWLFAKEEG